MGTLSAWWFAWPDCSGLWLCKISLEHWSLVQSSSFPTQLECIDYSEKKIHHVDYKCSPTHNTYIFFFPLSLSKHSLCDSRCNIRQLLQCCPNVFKLFFPVILRPHIAFASKTNQCLQSRVTNGQETCMPQINSYKYSVSCWRYILLFSSFLLPT